MFKKIIYYTVNTLSIIIIVAAVVVLLSVVLTRGGETPDFMGYSLFRVVTGSMKPEINENDLIVVRKTDPSEVKTGDVISFYSSDPKLNGAVNTHRVTEIANDGGTITFTTKGDANLVEDQYTVNGKNLIGVVVFKSGFLGKLSGIISNPLVFFPIIIVPILIILVTNLVKTFRLAGDAAKEEEQAAITEAIEKAKKLKQEQTSQAAAVPEDSPEKQN